VKFGKSKHGKIRSCGLNSVEIIKKDDEGNQWGEKISLGDEEEIGETLHIKVKIIEIIGHLD